MKNENFKIYLGLAVGLLTGLICIYQFILLL